MKKKLRKVASIFSPWRRDVDKFNHHQRRHFLFVNCIDVQTSNIVLGIYKCLDWTQN